MKVDSNLKTSERTLGNPNNLIDTTLKTKITNRFDFQNDLLTLKTKSIGKDQKKISYGRKFVEIDLNHTVMAHIVCKKSTTRND